MTESLSLAARIPLWGSRLIEASAGTGKTYTISALYLRLVLGHGAEQGYARALTPPEILVMTFTEAATFELKERIRRRLTEGARFFRARPEAEGDAFLCELRADYSETEWPRCARVLEQAALWMDDAAISTIHSWCYRMLREHAFQSGSVFNPRLVTDQSRVIADLFKDYWRQHAYPLPDALAKWMAAEFAGPSGLAKAGKLGGGAVQTPSLPLSVILDQALAAYQNRLHSYKQVFIDGLNDVRTLLEAAIAHKQVNGNKLRANWLNGWLNKLDSWAHSDAATLDLGSGWERLTPAGLQDAWKQGEPPSHPVFDALQTLRERLAGLVSPRQNVLEHAQAWVQSRLAESKQDRSEMGFDDMIHHLHQALESEDGAALAATLRAQFPAALIDEFQDTDPIQYAIVDRIYQVKAASPETAVLMIGDPKQAIYSFRGADIHTYLRARQDTAGRHYTLGMNFRSSQPMVEAVNRLFDHAEQAQDAGAFLFRQGTEHPLPFVPVEARGRDDALYINTVRPAAVQFYFIDSDAAIGVQAYRENQAEACADQITAYLNAGQQQRAYFESDERRKALQAADIAVLVREGKEADLIRQALARRGVRSVYLSESASVLHSAEAQDIVRCLRACAEPGNERLLRAALATPMVGLTTLELDQLFNDELAWEREVLQFRGFHQCWQRQGVLPMLRLFFQSYGIPQKLAQQHDGERRLTNLLHVAEWLQQASTELEGEQALIHAFCEQIHQSTGQSDDTILRLESDADLVKIVTIHKSKGLEYPLVFLPFTARSRPLKTGETVSRYDETGVLRDVLLQSDEDVALADQERLAEDLRLLYVALTRAQHLCWIGLADVCVGNSRQSGLPQNAWGHVLSALDGASLKARLDTLIAAHPRLFQTADLPLTPPVYRPAQAQTPFVPTVRTFLRPPWPSWGITSYSALQFGARPDTALQSALDFLDLSVDSAAEQNWVDAIEEPLLPGSPALRSSTSLEALLQDFPRGPQAGTFLHGLLEWCARQGFAQVLDDPAQLRDLIARRCRVRGWETWIEGLQRWVLHLLDMPLEMGNTGRLRLAGLARYQVELEFWFEMGTVRTEALDDWVTRHRFAAKPRPQALPQRLAGMMKGFMDLVFEHEGRYYVLDYKSNALAERSEDYTIERLEQAVLSHRYDLQAALYALALHRHLEQRLPEYDPAQHFGGVGYFFLRGIQGPCQGLLLDPLEPAWLDQLDQLMQGVDVG